MMKVNAALFPRLLLFIMYRFIQAIISNFAGEQVGQVLTEEPASQIEPRQEPVSSSHSDSGFNQNDHEEEAAADFDWDEPLPFHSDSEESSKVDSEEELFDQTPKLKYGKNLFVFLGVGLCFNVC